MIGKENISLDNSVPKRTHFGKAQLGGLTVRGRNC